MIMLGYAVSNAFHDDADTTMGCFLYCHNGRIFSRYTQNQAYTTPISEDSIVVVNLDNVSRTISYDVNGESRGAAFHDVHFPEGPLFPCVGMMRGDATGVVTLLDAVVGEL